MTEACLTGTAEISGTPSVGRHRDFAALPDQNRITPPIPKPPSPHAFGPADLFGPTGHPEVPFGFTGRSVMLHVQGRRALNITPEFFPLVTSMRRFCAHGPRKPLPRLPERCRAPIPKRRRAVSTGISSPVRRSISITSIASSPQSTFCAGRWSNSFTFPRAPIYISRHRILRASGPTTTGMMSAVLQIEGEKRWDIWPSDSLALRDSKLPVPEDRGIGAYNHSETGRHAVSSARLRPPGFRGRSNDASSDCAG